MGEANDDDKDNDKQSGGKLMQKGRKALMRRQYAKFTWELMEAHDKTPLFAQIKERNFSEFQSICWCRPTEFVSRRGESNTRPMNLDLNTSLGPNSVGQHVGVLIANIHLRRRNILEFGFHTLHRKTKFEFSNLFHFVLCDVSAKSAEGCLHK